MTKDVPTNPAELAAEKTRQSIQQCIDDRKCFLVEAGAGAGKTYSLIHALRYIIDNQGRQLLRCNQRVACITYTNVATDEIKSRTDRHPAIQSDTIHSFCWSLIKPFQPSIKQIVSKLANWPERLTDAGGIGDRSVDYNLGYPKVEDKLIMLHHNDVIAIIVALLEQPKFRALVRDRYPILLIDEYQDTDKAFAEAIVKHFVRGERGPLVGFFGDHWQKIYGAGCGRIEDASLQVIGKEANFRSVPKVVEMLNRMRPELPQAVKDQSASGFVGFYHTNAWQGERLTGPHSKGDLPPDIAHNYLVRLRQQLTAIGWDFSPSQTKILMLTHKVLAAEQGYRNLAEVFPYNESFIQKEDAHIAFFVDTLEPVCNAFESGKFGEMLALLGGSRPSIKTHSEKVRWKSDMDKLLQLRESGTIGDVIDYLGKSMLRLPKSVERREQRAAQTEGVSEGETTSVERLLLLKTVRYREVVALARFIEGHTPFETKHGVKGAEFENVLVVFGRGWNQYDFNQMLELAGGSIPSTKLAMYERNRNLFYVACSRPKKRLALLFTQKLSDAAISTARHWFGNDAMHSLVAT